MPAPVALNRRTLVEEQLRATEQALYEMADIIDRIMADYTDSPTGPIKTWYTKVTPDEIGGR